MKKIFFMMLAIIPTVVFAQISDNFSDGDFTKNPTWIGNVDDFIINSDGELQSNVSGQTGSSFLATKSQIIDDATWEFTVKINGTTSSSNSAVVYLTSDRADVTKSLNGYCVIVGGTKDEISLYKQNGTFSGKKEIISGKDKSIDMKKIEVDIKVTRSKSGKFQLFRKIEGKDNKFVLEGEVKDNDIKTANYFGVVAKYTKSTGKNYIFDNIKIKGTTKKDTTPPYLTSLSIVGKNRLQISFSEEIKTPKETFFIVDNEMGRPSSIQLSKYNTQVELTFDKPFKEKEVYTVTIKDISDNQGNILKMISKKTGIPEEVSKGDLIINEILFNPKKGMPEYFEIYNTSDKVLSLNTIYFGVYSKTKKEYKFTNQIPAGTLILPKGYICVSKNSQALKKDFNTPQEAEFVDVNYFSSLSNSEAGIYLIDKKDTTICDEVFYSEKWHHPLIRDDKGVSLEKVNPLFDSNNPNSWHSASFDVNYGTPGYKNSQYIENSKKDDSKKATVWVEPEVFTPDNDGNQDICFIKYKTEDFGNTANIMIFTSAGVKVRQIASSHLLSDDGYIIWDGKTDRGKNVNPGIYVLYFEIINTKTGSRKVEKLPIVVSAR